MVNENAYRLGAAPSVIRKLYAYGLEQAKKIGRENVYDYSLGNPSIPSPPKVNASIHQIVEETDSLSLHGYSLAAGFEEVRASIAADLTSRFGMNIRAGDLFLTCGAAPALIAAIRALNVENSEFVIQAPFFPEYVPFVRENGGVPRIVPPDLERFQINIPEMDACITEKTQAVIINSPNNPSGVVYTREKLEQLAALLQKKSETFGHPVYIIADEPYRELVYGGTEVPFIPAIYRNTVVCYSYSKSLSLPGERIGYVCVPPCAEDHEALYYAVAGASRIMGHVCPPSLIQRVIGCCAEERPDLAAYDENRTLLYESLTEMGYQCPRPDGAFYLLVKAPNGDAGAFSELAKEKYNLLVVPADAFGCPGYFRLSYCVSNDMIRRSLPAFQALIRDFG